MRSSSWSAPDRRNAGNDTRTNTRAHHHSSIGCTLETHGAVGKFESPQDDRRRILGVDGVHDLGGLDGFGPVEHKDEEPLFEHNWERRVFRLMIGSLRALGGPGGRFRHSIERTAPEHYLSSPYYEHWLTGVTTMAVESGFATQDELDRRAGDTFRSPAPIAVCCPTISICAPNPATRSATTFVSGLAPAVAYPRAALRAGQARHGRTRRRRVQHRRHRGPRWRIGSRPPLLRALHVTRIVGDS